MGVEHIVVMHGSGSSESATCCKNCSANDNVVFVYLALSLVHWLPQKINFFLCK